MKKFNNQVQEIISSPWAILPERLPNVIGLLHDNQDKIKLELELIKNKDDIPEIKSQTNDPIRMVRPARIGRIGSAAIIPIDGTIMQQATPFMEFMGFVGADNVAAALRELAVDDSVKTIVLDINSPGGSAFGIRELAEEIMNIRNDKKVVAVANSIAASAALWIAAAATEFVVTPSGFVGSIGVFMRHDDHSESMKMMGINPTFISAGKFKVEGNPFEPLSDEAKAAIQILIDDNFKAFVGSVAKGRGVSATVVRNDFGQGRVMVATEALKVGLVDRIATMNDTMIRVLRRDRSSNRSGGNSVMGSIRDLESFLRDEGGLSNSLAKRVASQGFPADENSGTELESSAETEVLNEIKSLSTLIGGNKSMEEK